MTSDVIVRELAVGGVDEAARDRIAALFEAAIGTLQHTHHRAPDGLWWVPGRLEVFGKHTDYAGGRTLIATVPRGFAFAAAGRDDGIVRIGDARTGETAELSARALARESGLVNATGWSRYVAVIIARFVKNFPAALPGADIAFISDLPRAAGVSSSSALTVGAALSIARLGRLDEQPEWRANIASPIALAGYLASVENGMTFGTLVGGRGVGTHSGSEDHTAMLCCRSGQLSQYAFLPVRHIGDSAMPSRWAFVIASSGVAAEKSGAAQALYNRASLGARALLTIWNAESPRRSVSLADALLSSTDAAARLRESIRHTRVADWSAAYLERRLAHFIAEDSRVPHALAALQQEDSVRLGELAAASQADADELLGNQIPETNELARLARANGAFAACAFGAGFGGSVWALVPRDEAETAAAEWMAAYRLRFPHHDQASWFIATPGPALIEIPAT
jgi:galactokinase